MLGSKLFDIPSYILNIDVLYFDGTANQMCLSQLWSNKANSFRYRGTTENEWISYYTFDDTAAFLTYFMVSTACAAFGPHLLDNNGGNNHLGPVAQSSVSLLIKGFLSLLVQIKSSVRVFLSAAEIRGALQYISSSHFFDFFSLRTAGVRQVVAIFVTHFHPMTDI